MGAEQIMSEEEIRLIKGYFNDGYCCDLDELKEIANKMIDQLQQKENIIKEIREYIEMHTPSDIGICGNKTKRYYTLGEDSVDHILEILGSDK